MNYDKMIAMSRGPQRGSAVLAEDSPMEAPVAGNNHHFAHMAPATRELVLKSRTQEIEKFAESRQLNAGAILGIADAAMRLGRVPDLRQYGFSGDDAKAIKHFVAGDVLNLAIEDVTAMDAVVLASEDRDIERRVKTLTQSGAQNLLTRLESKDSAMVKVAKRRGTGFVEALEALKTGDLKATKALLGEGATMSAACGAIAMAMGAASDEVRKQIDDEIRAEDVVTHEMRLNNSFTMYRPSPLSTTRTAKPEDAEEQEEKAAMSAVMGPGLGINPYHKTARTIEDMARMANIPEVAENSNADNTGNVEEGSQSWKKLSGKLRSRAPGAMARASRKQAKAGGRPNPQGEFVRTGRDSGYNRVDPRHAAHKAARGVKTKGRMEAEERPGGEMISAKGTAKKPPAAPQPVKPKKNEAAPKTDVQVRSEQDARRARFQILKNLSR